MLAELIVLSGRRVNERIQLDRATTSIGDAVESDVVFPDAGAQGKRILLSRSEAGWRLTNKSEAKVWVDSSTISSGGSAKLASGAVIRLSLNGPEFMFNVGVLEATHEDAPANAQSPAANSPPVYAPPVPTERPVEPTLPAAEDHNEQTQREENKRPVHKSSAQATAKPVASKGANAVVWAIVGVGIPITVLAIAVALLAWTLRPNSRENQAVVQAPPDQAENGETDLEESNNANVPRDQPNTEHTGGESKSVNTSNNDDKVETVDGAQMGQAAAPTKVEEATQRLAELQRSVFLLLLEVRDGDRVLKMPYATGWAVDDRNIVASAFKLNVLKRGQEEKGYKVFAYAPGESKLLEVDAIRLHPKFDANTPEKGVSMLHEVGMATLKSPHSSPSCKLMPISELPRPIKGLTLKVVGYEGEFEAGKPFDDINPPALVISDSQVADTRTFSDAGDAKPLLTTEYSGSAKSLSYGAAVADENGLVIGLLTIDRDVGYVVMNNTLNLFRPSK